jgi:hypothetical protein
MRESSVGAPRARHPLSAFGITLTTISALLLLFLWALEASGRVENPYLGLFAFIAIPSLIVLGLLCVPLGAWLSRRRAQKGLAPLSWPRVDFADARARRIGLLVIAATFVNLLIVSVAGYEAVHWMETPSFCGQVCHVPMEPHYTQWQQAPHARVRCVDCHVGSGTGAFVQAKLNGIRQLIGVMTGAYERPVPTPVRNMRPPEYTCARCHWPGRDIGDRVRVVREYADDEAGSETTTVVRLHVGRARPRGSPRRGFTGTPTRRP